MEELNEVTFNIIRGEDESSELSGVSYAPTTTSNSNASAAKPASNSATAPSGAPAIYATALREEKTKWSTRYPINPLFKKQIDDFRTARRSLFDEFHKDKIQGENFKKIIESLGTDLAVAYLMADASRQWTPEFEKACMAGGNEYAKPSRWSFGLNAIPGIARSAAMLGLQMAKYVHPEYAASITTAQAAVNVAYVVVQLYTIVYLPFWNASAQSDAVALQASHGPRDTPDVKSDKLTKEDGTEGSLRKKKDIQQDIDNCDAKLATNPGDATLQAQRRNLELEAFTGELYRQLVVTNKSGDARAVRSFINLAASLLSAYNAAIGYTVPNANDWPGQEIFRTLAAEVLPLITNSTILAALIAQPVLYYVMYTRGSGLDYMDKMATSFQIIAMTGKGNFDDAKLNCAVAKLDKVTKGRIVLVQENLKAVLEYDRKVYQSAMYALILKRSGSGGFIELKKTFDSALSDAILHKKDPRSAYLAELTRLGKQHTDIWPHIERISKLYFENEKSIELLAKGDLDALLKGIDSPLPFPTQQMLLGALKVALGGPEAANPENQAHYDRLSKLKGHTESLCDIGSINQTAQKLGQALAWGVAGSSSFNALKTFGSAIQAALMFTGEDYSAAIRGVALGVSSIQAVGSVFAMALGYSYQKFISKKALHRQRDKDKASMPNSGVMNRPWIRMDRMQQQVTEYRTLAAHQIDKQDVEGLVLDYVSDGSLIKDMVAQMGAVNLNPFKLAKYMQAKGGKLAPLNDKTSEQLISEARKQLDDNEYVSVDILDIKPTNDTSLHSLSKDVKGESNSTSDQTSDHSSNPSEVDSLIPGAHDMHSDDKGKGKEKDTSTTNSGINKNAGKSTLSPGGVAPKGEQKKINKDQIYWEKQKNRELNCTGYAANTLLMYVTHNDFTYLIGDSDLQNLKDFDAAAKFINARDKQSPRLASGFVQMDDMHSDVLQSPVKLNSLDVLGMTYQAKDEKGNTRTHAIVIARDKVVKTCLYILDSRENIDTYQTITDKGMEKLVKNYIQKSPASKQVDILYLDPAHKG